MNDIALLFVKSEHVSEIPQIKITTTSLLALEYQYQSQSINPLSV